MSFQDKLFQAGLINKKQLRKINQEQKIERKQKQGNRKKKQIEAAEKRAKAKAEKEARLVILRAQRAEREKIYVEKAQKRRVNQIINHHRIRFQRGDYPFWHYTYTRTHVHKFYVPMRIAWELRAGKLAIAIVGDVTQFEPEYVIIPREIAQKIAEIDADRILFLNTQPPDAADPSQRLYGTD